MSIADMYNEFAQGVSDFFHADTSEFFMYAKGFGIVLMILIPASMIIEKIKDRKR